REARGLNLAVVAEDLRIREDYLRALEGGIYDDLPGLPYAAGFVQSYAKYLRLDPADMVRRFKAEVDLAPAGGSLAFPEPVRYGRFPGILIAAICLLVAGALYGGWYFYGPQQNDGSGAKAPVMANTGGSPAKSGAGADTTQDAAHAAGKSAADAATATGKSAKSAATGGDASSIKSAGSASKPKDEASADAPAAPDLKRPDAGDSSKKVADTLPSDPSVGQSGTTSGAPKEPVTKPAAKKTAPAQVAALPNDETIVLRATANAWIQIKDKENRVVFVKVLRAGENYTVPKQAGLTMNVGNAGGLQVTVGGTKVKPLGPVNMPVFNVSLDPKALLKQRN
ncbi:MAG: RodZ domain-containing protein, partial [Pseudomonadota bacterium]